MSGVKRLELKECQEKGKKGSECYNPCGVKGAKKPSKSKGY